MDFTDKMDFTDSVSFELKFCVNYEIYRANLLWIHNIYIVKYGVFVDFELRCYLSDIVPANLAPLQTLICFMSDWKGVIEKTAHIFNAKIFLCIICGIKYVHTFNEFVFKFSSTG